MKYSNKLPLVFLYTDDPRHLLTLVVILITIVLIVRIIRGGNEGEKDGLEQ
jgi:hypothetical protein